METIKKLIFEQLKKRTLEAMSQQYRPHSNGGDDHVSAVDLRDITEADSTLINGLFLGYPFVYCHGSGIDHTAGNCLSMIPLYLCKLCQRSERAVNWHHHRSRRRNRISAGAADDKTTIISFTVPQAILDSLIQTSSDNDGDNKATLNSYVETRLMNKLFGDGTSRWPDGIEFSLEKVTHSSIMV